MDPPGFISPLPYCWACRLFPRFLYYEYQGMLWEITYSHSRRVPSTTAPALGFSWGLVMYLMVCLGWGLGLVVHTSFSWEPLWPEGRLLLWAAGGGDLRWGRWISALGSVQEMYWGCISRVCSLIASAHILILVYLCPIVILSFVYFSELGFWRL